VKSFQLRWGDAVCASTLTPIERAVAHAHARYASPDGTSVRPGVASIARDTGHGERTVRRARQSLERQGWLIVVRPGGSGPDGRLATEYRLSIPDPGQVDRGQGANPCHTDRGNPGQADPGQRDTGATQAADPCQSGTPPTQDQTKETLEPYPVEFDRAWQHYPRKTNKRGAFDAWRARVRSGIAVDELTRAVERYAEVCLTEGTPTRFTLHGSTFFGPQERWRDYLGPPASEYDAPMEVYR
jgi:hypothetical protein